MPDSRTRLSIDRVREACQRFPGWEDCPWLYLQIRKVSVYLTWLLLHTTLSANGVTFVGIVMGLITSTLFGLQFWLLGLLALQLVIVLDFSDGEVARFRSEQSKEGSYLDKVYHFLVHPSLFAGAAIGAYGIEPDGAVLVAGFVTVICVSLFPIVTDDARQLTVWEHYRQFVEEDAGNSIGTLGLQGSITSDTDFAGREKPLGLHPASLSRVAAVLRRAVAGWEFPYVLFVMSGSVLVQVFTDVVGIEGLTASPIVVFVLFFSLSYPPLIGISLVKTVRTRAIEREFVRAIRRWG